MLKKGIIAFVFLCNFLVSAQQFSDSFILSIDSLKQQNNYSEFIYVHLDEFAKNTTIESLVLYKNLESNLWRNPLNKEEKVAQLYFYINYAYQLKQFGFINESINYYEKAYSFYKRNYINYNIIEYCLKPLANNYTRLGDVDRAEDIIKITIEKAIKEKSDTQIGSGYLNLAAVYRTKGNYVTAIKYLNLGLLNASSNNQKAKIHSDKAINFLFLSEFENSKKEAILSNTLNVLNDLSISTRNSITLGSCFISKNKFEPALIEFEKALKFSKIIFGKNDRETAKIYNKIAEVYWFQNKSEIALSYYQKALITLLPNYIPKDIFENPKSTYFYPENTLKEAFDGRAKVLSQLNNFEEAVKNYELSFLIENELRDTYLSQNAKLLQQQENRNRSENCIELCYTMFQQSNNVLWLEKAFQFAEQTKSVVLLENKELLFAKSKIKNDSLFIKEEKLQLKKAELNTSITLEQLKNENAVLNVLAKLTKEREFVFQEIQLLNQEIDEKYPNLKANLNTSVSIDKIEEKLLLNNELLIEFFDGTRNVYIFSISKNKPISVVQIEKDEVFKEELLSFLKLFSDERGTALQNNINKYTSLGFKLFEHFFKKELAKNIILIPDGLFSFLPFDALITEKTEIINFEKLPYLIKKANISYAYSASILLSNTKNSDRKEDKLIGFFPVFKNNHRNLAELSFTEQEAKSIENEVEGDFLTFGEAVKNVFDSIGKKYSMLHLSTHATAGDFFTPPAIEFYDETLYLPEIYGYNLNLDLVVLSACETGIGTLRKGEGTMSLARGFSYAGVKNLIVSLWKVNDKSTEKLMAGFYKNYTKYGSKSAALQSSKLDYLNNKNISSLKKSPYYWASFIYIGEVATAGKKQISYWWFFIVGIILIGGFFFLKNSRFELNSK
ncbi:CHAT domain-containing protein [Lutibacter oceani]|uniref:CHAT domain-containing protein n=1 Tax=Lutibacter oceani TaxID=1853311 RepID=A0A3D9RTW5_9FLAO|nr:CHAT domain-containing tetratricopeptide repeat protein [Lutibacter oceani]REE83297.1 CHAT domain-containing protein [Lutibacter oceani]